jgi:exodeoxyribonuclease VII large subunit
MRRAWVSALTASLDALSPLRTLDRGYAVARGADGTTLGDIASFTKGTRFTLVVRDGTVDADTVDTHPADE